MKFLTGLFSGMAVTFVGGVLVLFSGAAGPAAIHADGTPAPAPVVEPVTLSPYSPALPPMSFQPPACGGGACNQMPPQSGPVVGK